MAKRRFRPKRFAVIGAGPVGNVIAAFLSRGGCEVTLCDIVPSLLAPARDPGIRIEGTDILKAKVARTTPRIEEILDDPPDVILVAVKATALPLIASALEGYPGEGRYVISWQNGIDTERVLAHHLGPEHVLRAVVNACMNPICAITGKTMAEVISDPILFTLVDSLIKEGIAVARANEIFLGPDFYPYCVGYIRSAGHHKPSMRQDIEAGRRTEIDYINGKIIEYGVQAGMATPFNTMVRGLVKALEPR